MSRQKRMYATVTVPLASTVTLGLGGMGLGEKPHASPSLSRTWICHCKMFVNNMLSILVNFICTDRRVHIAPIGVQPDKNFSLPPSCLVVQSGL